MLVAGRDLETQMRGAGSGVYVAAEFVFPRQHSAPQHAGIDPERVAYGVEAECVAAFRASRDPSLGVDEQQAFARISRHYTLLIDVDCIGQQREHQALFTSQAMTAGDVVVLGGQYLVEADEALDRS